MQIALTFDNLGEAADLERGLWPADAPLGHHPSVTVALPRLLDALDDLGLRATFCVEALNCEVYPDAVRGIAARGHACIATSILPARTISSPAAGQRSRRWAWTMSSASARPAAS